MLASPATASPEMALTARGRNSGSSRISAAKATNSPFPVIPTMKPGPAPEAPDSTRTTMASSERRKRPGRARVVAGVGRATSTSAADIEALPGQGHEDVLQARLLDSEAEHRYAVVDQVGHDLLHGHLAEGRGDKTAG